MYETGGGGLRRANPQKILRTVVLLVVILASLVYVPQIAAWHVGARRPAIVSSFELAHSPLQFHTMAGSAQVEIADGPVLFAHNVNEERPIASTTKIMTAYLVLSQPGLSLNRVVTITATEVDNDRRGLLKADSEVPLAVGQRATVQDLLWALMLPSADDSAWVLARTISGNPYKFVAMMNQTAARLGMHRTHYVDPDGVNHKGYSTAKDLLKLTTVAMTDPAFAQLVSTAVHHTSSFGTLTNLNQLLGQYPGAIGVKTGWTPWAGSCLVFAAKRQLDNTPLTLYGVVLGEPGFNRMFEDVKGLLNTGFSLPYRRLVNAHTVIAEQWATGLGAPKKLTFSLGNRAMGAFETGGTARIQWQWQKGLNGWQAGQVVGRCRVTQTGWSHPGPWVPIIANQGLKVPWWGKF